MAFIMDRLIHRFVPKNHKVKVLNYEFKKKYSYLVSLDIPELDQYFNIRLPEKTLTLIVIFLRVNQYGI